MKVHFGGRLFLAAAVASAVAVVAMGFLIALGVHSVVAGPGADPAGPVPNPGHAWSDLQGHGVGASGVYVATDNEPFLIETNGMNSTPRVYVGTDGNVGIGTTSPVARLHVDWPSMLTSQEVARITFENGADSIGTTGMRVVSTPLAAKGAQTGVSAETSKTGGSDPQRGSTRGMAAQVDGYASQGHFRGVYGQSKPNELANFNGTFTSTGVGGYFTARPDASLDLDGTGTYWVGGVYGEVAGTINYTPASGAVAGVIGVDNAAGTANSYAGYFVGDSYFSGEVGIGTTTPGQKLEVNGGIRLNTTTSKPTCDVDTRGTLWFTQGGTSVADTLEVCAKNAGDTYAWVPLY